VPLQLAFKQTLIFALLSTSSLALTPFLGGYAFVYVAQDVQTGTEYALKRLLGADQQSCTAIINEIGIHKQVSGHGNIVAFIGSSYTAPSSQLGAQYLLLTELCKGKRDLGLQSAYIYK